MRKSTKSKLKTPIIFFCFLLTTTYCLAENIDIAVTEIILPEKIYLNEKATINIVLLNKSDIDLEGCMFTVEANSGSKVNRAIPLSRNIPTNIELVWVPLQQGKIDFKVMLVAPEGFQEENIKDNQLTKIVTVLSEKSPK